jgi:glucose-6-phosphate 1-dehydrogenase
MKKESIKDMVQNAITKVLEALHVDAPSRKTQKAISRVSKRIKRDLKKQSSAALKKARPSKKRKETNNVSKEASNSKPASRKVNHQATE